MVESEEPFLAEYFKDSPVLEEKLRTVMGRVFLNLSQYGKAEMYLRRAHDLSFHHLGPMDPDTLQLQVYLAILDRRMGYYKKALTNLENTGVNQWQVLGERHPDYLANLAAQANLLLQLYRYKDSVLLHEHVLALMAVSPEVESTQVLVVLAGYAMALGSVGQVEQAIPLIQQTIKEQARILGENHPYVWNNYHNLAILLNKRGEIVKANAMLEKVLEHRTKHLKRSHKRTMETLRVLASSYHNQGRHQEALPLLQEVILFLKTNHPHHPDLGKALNVFSNILKVTHDYEGAEKVTRELVAFRFDCSGVRSRETLRSQNNLADLYLKSGQLELAEKLASQILNIRIETEGYISSGVVFSLQTLGQIREARGKDSTEFFESAWEIAGNPFINNDLLAAYCQGLYGKALIQKGNYSGARELLENSLASFPDVNHAWAREICGVLENL